MKQSFKRSFMFVITLLALTFSALGVTPALAANSWQQVGAAGFSPDTASFTSLAIYSGTPYVAYIDGSATSKVSVMKFNGTSWVQVGAAGFSTAYAMYSSLAINSTGTPYVAYMDGTNSNKVSVMKFNGTSWVQVGTAGFSASSATYISLAIDSTGTPYVAYEDTSIYRASVMKFNGTSWVQVGAAGFSASSAPYTSLAIDSTGTPYVAYEDGNNGNKASVMKFNGTSWVQVGSAGFSAGPSTYTSLAINSTGTPYLVYEDNSFYKANVMKFNGSSWVQVGAVGFSAASAGYTSLTFDSTGTPYVAYGDNSVYRASVMKFDGTNWVQVGSAGFSAASTSYNSIAIDSTGVPYVAYYDSNVYKASVMKFAAPPPAAPTVSTDSVNATGNININFTVSNLGYPASVTNFGVVYNTTGSPTTSDSKVDHGSLGSTGSFSVGASEMTLTPGTKYFVRAFATNATGTSYGSELVFYGSPAAFTTIAPLTNATGVSTSPTISWNASSGETDYQYCYALTTETPNHCYTPTDPGWISTSGATSAQISGLQGGTQYMWGVRASVGSPASYTFSTDSPLYFTTSALSATKAITAFDFASPAVSGTITEATHTIAVMVPFGTNVTALVPTITHTGVSVSPNSGVAQDFSSPVTYTVTAADASTQDYTVTVTVALNPAKAITAFSFASPSASGTITEATHTIAITVPFGTNVTALVPTITHNGASINPNSGVAQNFTNPVTYTVTAANASTQDYTVTVTVSANTAKAITAFNFASPAASGVITEATHTIAVTVPFGTNVTALVPTITHNGVSINPNSGVAQNFTNPVIYTVTAANATTQDYTVTVTVAAIKVYIGGTLQGSYGLTSGQTTRQNYTGVDNGPVKVVSTDGTPIVSSIRDAWAVNGATTSFSQLMGLPQEQLSDTYVFPGYNNVTLNDQLRIANVDTTATSVTVTIGGDLKGTYPLAAGAAVRINYPGLDSGPVVVQGTSGVKIIAAIREAWAVNGTTTSFVQLMGLPAGQLSNKYVYAAYNNVTLNEQLRIGNVDPTQSTVVTVTIGGTVQGTYPLGPGEAVRVNYPGLDSGPVVVEGTAGVNIISSIRDAWATNGVTTSFSQLMGMPAGQLSDKYVYPGYNNVTLDDQLRIANADTVPSTVTVTIGGVLKGTYPLAAGAAVRVNYPGLDSGPVVVQGTSGVKIISTIREAWAVNGVTQSFVQLMGLPAQQLSTTYWFPAYNNVTLNEQLRIGMP